MKIIFRPAIKLFNKFNLLAKFLLISSVLLLLLGVSTYQYFSSVNSYIAFSSKEIVGVEYSKESKTLMMNVLNYRNSINNNTGDISEEETKIDESIEKLRNLNNKYGNKLDNKGSKKEVSVDIQNFFISWENMKTSQNVSNEDVNNLFVLINTLHLDISDNSNLTLDPDLDTYYCMDVLMFRSLPLLMNLYDQKILIESINPDFIDSESAKSIIQLETQGTILADTILGDMNTAFRFNDSKKINTLTIMKEEINQLQTDTDNLTVLMNKINNQIDKKQIITTIDTCIKANSTMYDNLDSKLMEMLKIRVNAYKQDKHSFIIALILAIPVLLYIYIAFMMSITNTIKNINSGLIRIANGDLVSRIEVTSKDELGVVSSGINFMVSNLKKMIQTVATTSSSVGNTVEQVNKSIVRFDQNINTIAGTIEVLSGSTQELSAATEEIGATVESLDNSAMIMQKKALECLNLANNISGKTGITIDNINKAKQNTENILFSTQSDLLKSLEAVKSVDKINILSEAIMQITAQTNMLALNAEIEAARAGEFGKGFSVVADEVRKLAEQSKTTATQIQEVVKDISSSVESLTKNSEKIIYFIKTNVIKEFNNVIDFGNDFASDASIFKDFAKSVSTISDTLSESVQALVATILEMANANNYSASEIQHVATDIIELKNESGRIVEKIINVVEDMRILEEESKLNIESASQN